VVQDAEVHNGLKAGAADLKRRRVCPRQGIQAVRSTVQSPSGAFHLLGVEVGRRHMGGAQPVHDDLDAHAATTADLQDLLTF